AGADVDADAPPVLHAGGDAPVPERAIRPDAAAEVLHRVATRRVHHVAPLADRHRPVARHGVVLGVELEAVGAPRPDDVEALLARWPMDDEVGDDVLAALGAAGEVDLQIAAVGDVRVRHRAAAKLHRLLDLFG